MEEEPIYEEEPNTEQDTEQEPDEPDDILTFPERPPFDNQELINAHYLRNTELKEKFLDLVDDILIYESAKRALRVLITENLDQTWFLANLERGDKNSAGSIDELFAAKNSFDLKVITSTASMCKSDVNNADMANIINSLRSNYKIAILSRAKGPNRERILNKLTSVEQIMTKRTEGPAQVKNTERKRKLGIF